jgi:hypothetical protein
MKMISTFVALRINFPLERLTHGRALVTHDGALSPEKASYSVLLRLCVCLAWGQNSGPDLYSGQRYSRPEGISVLIQDTQILHRFQEVHTRR